MAFKFVVLCAVLAVANAGLSPVLYSAPVSHYAVANPSVDAVGETQQNVVRSYAGTVSQYSKAVDTPYSSVRKSDTRINNNVYTPTYAKTLTYAAPAPVVKYAAPQAVYTHQAAPAVYAHQAAPAVYAHQAAPAVYAHQAAPAVYAHQAAPAVYAHQAAPAVYSQQVLSHAAPTVYAHQSAVPAAVYSHAAPAAVIAQPASKAYVSHVDPTYSAYSSKTISYSPAAAVAHVTFDGFGAHYGY